jgi:hypothetical protein
MFLRSEFCSLELCQILEDNGYNDDTDYVICKEDCSPTNGNVRGIKGKMYYLDLDLVTQFHGKLELFLKCPTIYEVRKWIERHLNWRIEVSICASGLYSYMLYNVTNKETLIRDLDLEVEYCPTWSTEEEALSDAIRMCLQIGKAKTYGDN